MSPFSRLILSCILALAPLAAHAELVWVQGKGWEVQGGLAEAVMGKPQDAKSALEAMNKAREAQEKDHRVEAIQLYQKVIDEYPNSVFAPEAYFQSAKLFVARRQFEQANKRFQEILTRYPDYPGFNQVIGQKFATAELIQSGRRPYLWGWMPWFRDYNLGAKIYEEVVKSAPYDSFAPLALMNLATLSEKMGKPEMGIDALERLISNYPQSMLTPDAYLLMGKIYRDLVQGPYYDQAPTRQAINFYKDFLILYPQDANTAHATENLALMYDTYARSRLLMGDFYYRYRNNRRAALVYYNETISIAPDSKAAQEARASIDKIKRGIMPPPTVYDILFGRYRPPTDRQFEEQMHYEMLASQRFQEEATEAFLSVPGAEAGEVITPGGQVQEYEGLGDPYWGPMDPAFDPALDPAMTPLPDSGTSIPVDTMLPTGNGK